MTEKVYKIVKSKEFAIISSIITVIAAFMLGYNAYYSVKINKRKIKELENEYKS